MVTEAKDLWPECVLVKGRPYHSEANGGVERLNRSHGEVLGNMMAEEDSPNWPILTKKAMCL